jgi:transposase
MDQEVNRRRRRSYSAEFRADAVAACLKAGASTSAEALKRSMNANVLRRWVVEAERSAGAIPSAKALPAPVGTGAKASFVALPAPAKSADEMPITVEVHRGAMTVSVQWPRSAVRECAMWLREVLK